MGKAHEKFKKITFVNLCIKLIVHPSCHRTYNDTNDDIADMHVAVMLKWNYCCVGVCMCNFNHLRNDEIQSLAKALDKLFVPFN